MEISQNMLLKFFGDIPGMFLHYSKVSIIFLYVCLSVSWLTSILKLDKYRDISSSWWYIFLNFFGDTLGKFASILQLVFNFLYGCESVSWCTSLLKLGWYRDISCSGRVIFLIVFRQSLDVFTLLPNNQKFYVCL